MERTLRRVANGDRDHQIVIRLHPEVALFLLEQEPNFLKNLRKTLDLDLELRDDPVIAVDEFRLVSQPAGRDVTEKYLVA
jgi:ribonuclease G